MKTALSSMLIKLAVTTAVAMTAGTALAEVNLRWAPADTSVALGDSLRMSVFLDEPVDIRTIEVTVSYDSTIIASLGGGPGTLFADSGHFIWSEFEDSEAGQWHGFAIVMGAGLHLTGPGELLHWRALGVDFGTTGINTIEVRLFAPDASLIADVYLADTTVTVHDPISGIDELPSRDPELRLQPNPFNPRTLAVFTLEQDSHARLTVFDARGRRVARLYDAPAAAGSLQVAWNGKDDRGLAQPGGVYFFHLETRATTVRTKGVLLK